MTDPETATTYQLPVASLLVAVHRASAAKPHRILEPQRPPGIVSTIDRTNDHQRIASSSVDLDDTRSNTRCKAPLPSSSRLLRRSNQYRGLRMMLLTNVNLAAADTDFHRRMGRNDGRAAASVPVLRRFHTEVEYPMLAGSVDCRRSVVVVVVGWDENRELADHSCIRSGLDGTDVGYQANQLARDTTFEADSTIRTALEQLDLVLLIDRPVCSGLQDAN